MADAIVSPLAERLTNFIVDEIKNQVSLVRGVKEKVEKLSEDLKTIRLFLDDAERRGYKDQIVKDWLWRLEHASYEMEDLLDEWEMATIHEVPSRSSCLCFKNVTNHHRIGKKIKDITTKLDGIFKEKERYSLSKTESNLTKSESTDPTGPVGRSWRGQSTSIVKINEIQGRDLELNNLLRKFMEAGSLEQESAVRVISLVGLGGIGKTTLAQLIYNDKQVKDCYPFRIWICVSDTFDQVRIAKEILEKVQGNLPEVCGLDMLLERLKNCISSKKFLLVMDDVWTEDDAKWGPLKNCLESGGLGSKILVTTRKESVAITMGTKRQDIHNVGRLSDENCWLLLSQIALLEKSKRNKFEDVGKRIAKKCDGLPLAAKALGSLLRFKYTEDEWENIFNSEIWELEQAEIDVFPHLLLSYNELSPTLKRCFSYCAVFPKDFDIKVEDLIQSWSALGYLGTEGELELRGREYFNNLAMRSLFQDFQMDKKNDQVILECKMHDIVHDFATFLKKNTSKNKVEANCNACGSSLASHIKNYRSLFCGWWDPRPEVGCECMVCVRVLSIQDCDLTSIPIQVKKLIHLRYLNLGGRPSVFLNFEGGPSLFQIVERSPLSRENLIMISKLCNLKALNLSNCYLQEIPQEIGNLVKLRELKLEGNTSLKDLPETICNLQELRSLSLKDCQGLCKLPREIQKLEKLKHLNLKNCGLQEIPQEIGKLVKLQELILNGNESLKDLPESIFNLKELRSLSLKGCKNLCKLPREIQKLGKLKHLNLNNCGLQEIPQEIGNLVELLNLNLGHNESLEKLPESIYNLRELQSLCLKDCNTLVELPCGIHRLEKLKYLDIRDTYALECFPDEDVGRMTHLRTLRWFKGRLSHLKNLNELSGSLKLLIANERGEKDVVEEAKGAELSKKVQLERLELDFWYVDKSIDNQHVSMAVLDALKPHPNLNSLLIRCYNAFKLPDWISSPINQVRKIELYASEYLFQLPPLGKLPCLEWLELANMKGIELVGLEFLGITESRKDDNGDDGPSSSAPRTTVAFPMLQELRLDSLPQWKGWEDITIEEQNSKTLSCFPNLKSLVIRYCSSLKALPHGLLRKATKLELLSMIEADLLAEHYDKKKEDSAWKFISHIPEVIFSLDSHRVVVKNDIIVTDEKFSW